MLLTKGVVAARSFARSEAAHKCVTSLYYTNRVLATARTPRVSVRSMSEEGKAAQESAQTGCEQVLSGFTKLAATFACRTELASYSGLRNKQKLEKSHSSIRS